MTPAGPGGGGARVARAAAIWAAVNLLLFAAYHLAFLRSFAPGASPAETVAALGRGVRLGAALLGQELFVLGVLALATRHLRARALVAGLWGLAALHGLALAANLLVYGERNQHAAEVLLANVTAPFEVWVAVKPYLAAHPGAPLLAAAAVVVLALAARRHVRGVRGRVDLWRPRPALVMLAVLALLAVPSIDLEHNARGQSHLRILKTRRLIGFTGYATNQAVANPVYDLLHVHLPAAVQLDEYQLGREEALATARELLGLPGEDARYPLLRTIEGRRGLGLDSVVVVQVEGLGASLLRHRVDGTPVMPFLARLASEGLDLEDVYQSYATTQGAVFATVTSMPATPGVIGRTSRFWEHAIRGHYACLARVLDGDGYRHHAFAGFRQRGGEFTAFMGNQGFRALGFEGFLERLGARAARDVNLLGVFDGPLLQEVARSLVATPGRFTAYVMTATSHSPWLVPPEAPRPFGVPQMDVFRYVDESLRAFVDRLRAEHPGFARTLFVILGDHTSVTVGDGLAERLRIPVLLWSAGLAAQRDQWRDRPRAPGSQVDVLPTILGLLEGTHRYAGIGHDLLAPARLRRGAIVGGLPDSHYVSDRFVLRYSPQTRAAGLFAIEGGEIALRDVAGEHPDVVRRLRREFLALQETADRLTREGRVFPR